MFIHLACGSEIYLLTQDIYQILARITLSNNTVRPTMGVLRIKEGKTPATYWCDKCNVQVPINHIETTCGHCGHRKSVRDVFVSKTAKGIAVLSSVYCLDCIKELGLVIVKSANENLTHVYVES